MHGCYRHAPPHPSSRTCARARARAHTHTHTHTRQVLGILPLAAVHTLGNLLTNVSLGSVAVSFTHTIKVRGSNRGGGSVW